MAQIMWRKVRQTMAFHKPLYPPGDGVRVPWSIYAFCAGEQVRSIQIIAGVLLCRLFLPLLELGQYDRDKGDGADAAGSFWRVYAYAVMGRIRYIMQRNSRGQEGMSENSVLACSALSASTGRCSFLGASTFRMGFTVMSSCFSA